MKLLTSNAKLKKNSKLGYYGLGLSLSPHKTGNNKNVCPSAGLCKDVCVLYYVGLTKMPNVRKAMNDRKQLFFNDRPTFLNQLHYELNLLQNKKNAVCRLNTGSDISWEKIDKTLFDYNITYYDYTKETKRILSYIEGKLPKNYELTYSYSEKSDIKFVKYILSKGVNVAIVFDTKYDAHSGKGMHDALPTKFKIGGKYYKVVDGDISDVRLAKEDGKGVIVGLRAKGIRKDILDKYRTGGFVVNPKGSL